MENQFKEEIEALQALKEYNVKIVKALKEIIPELKGEKQPDTDEYLQNILKGINWEIQVINGTMKYLNREEEVVSKEGVNSMIVKLNETLQNKGQDEQVAAILEERLLPFLEELDQIAEKAVA